MCHVHEKCCIVEKEMKFVTDVKQASWSNFKYTVKRGALLSYAHNLEAQHTPSAAVQSEELPVLPVLTANQSKVAITWTAAPFPQLSPVQAMVSLPQPIIVKREPDLLDSDNEMDPADHKMLCPFCNSLLPDCYEFHFFLYCITLLVHVTHVHCLVFSYLASI